MPIDATNGLSAVRRPAGECAGALDPISRQPFGVRLLLEADDLAGRVEPEDAHLRRVVGRHRLRGDRDVGVALDVRLDELGEVHAVDVVAGEDQVVLGVDVAEVARRLPHRVGRALKPLFAFRRLLGREHLDEAAGEQIQRYVCAMCRLSDAELNCVST